jgi:excisionase family DNA binding protein
MGIGNVLSSSLSGMTGAQQGGAQQGGAQGAAVGGAANAAMPDVMTPTEAAGILRVSEEDVVAAIEAGDLKARKIGSAYRISREALEQFLKG